MIESDLEGDPLGSSEVIGRRVGLAGAALAVMFGNALRVCLCPRLDLSVRFRAVLRIPDARLCPYSLGDFWLLSASPHGHSVLFGIGNAVRSYALRDLFSVFRVMRSVLATGFVKIRQSARLPLGRDHRRFLNPATPLLCSILRSSHVEIVPTPASCVLSGFLSVALHPFLRLYPTASLAHGIEAIARALEVKMLQRFWEHREALRALSSAHASLSVP